MGLRVGEAVLNKRFEHSLRLVEFVPLEVVAGQLYQSGLSANLSDVAPSHSGGKANRRVGFGGIGIDFDRALEMSNRFRRPILLNQPEALLEGQRPVRPRLLSMRERKGKECQDGEHGPRDEPMGGHRVGVYQGREQDLHRGVPPGCRVRRKALLRADHVIE